MNQHAKIRIGHSACPHDCPSTCALEVELLDDKRIDGIEDQLADPRLYEKDPTTATQLAKERSQLSAQLETNEEKWLTMSAEYEEGVAE